MVQTIIDRCMQMHGAGGLTADYFMAEAFNYARWCRRPTGRTGVHQMALGKQVISAYAAEAGLITWWAAQAASLRQEIASLYRLVG